MSSVRVLSFLAIALLMLPTYIWPSIPDYYAWMAQNAGILLILIVTFKLTPIYEVGLRSLIALATLYTGEILLTDWWIPYKYIDYVVFVEIPIFFGGWFWVIHRPINLATPCDVRTCENVMLTFYRPASFFDILTAIVGLPVSSIGVFADGQWLRFRRSEPTLQLMDLRPNTQKYIVIDTGIPVSMKIRNIMKDLAGARARRLSSLYFRCRCVTAITPLLRALGPKWAPKGLDFIPGVYAYRRLVDERATTQENS